MYKIKFSFFCSLKVCLISLKRGQQQHPAAAPCPPSCPSPPAQQGPLVLTQCSLKQRNQQEWCWHPAQTPQQHTEPGRESGSPPELLSGTDHGGKAVYPFRAHVKEASGVWCSDKHTESKNSLSLLRRDPVQTGRSAQLGG